MSTPHESGLRNARRELIHELTGSASGLALALFMWGHMVLVGSILTGARGFDWMATMLEDYYIAQPTVFFVFILFYVHALAAGRKIPAKLRERRRLAQLSKDLRASGREHVAGSSENSPFEPHHESLLWIWQLRTGMIILAVGSFHLVLLALDVFTPLYGDRVGIEAGSTLARVAAGLWLPYAILLLCVEFHASVGLYRLAIKWGGGALLSRPTLRLIERILLWSVLGLGVVILLVLAGWLEPPLAFLLQASDS